MQVEPRQQTPVAGQGLGEQEVPHAWGVPPAVMQSALEITEQPLLDFNSGYVLRALDGLPKQGSKEPWKLRQSYPYDLRQMRHGSLLDGAMQFRRKGAPAQSPPPRLASSR